MATAGRYSPEVKERAVWMVLEHEREHNSQWAAIVSIAGKIGCSPETLRKRVRRTEIDTGRRGGGGNARCLLLSGTLDQEPDRG